MKYFLEILFVVLFLFIPLIVYGLFDIMTWLVEGNAKYLLVGLYPVYCILSLLVMDAWLKRHNRK